MQITIGYSGSNDGASAVQEATASINNPRLIIFISSYAALKDVSKAISEKYPGVPLIGTAGTSYYKSNASDQNLVVWAFGSDAKAQVGVIRYLSSCPAYDVVGLEKAINEVGPGDSDTVCLEFCTNDEERLVTTLNVALSVRKVPLVGGTVFGTPAGEKSYVCVNGELYDDACCYAVIKNTGGKIRTYTENIYSLRENGARHIATKVNLANKELISLDNKPAAQVYADELGISRNQIVDNVLENPLGRIIGDDVYICSQYAIGNNDSLICYKRANENDTIGILQLDDYEQINSDTRRRIQDENSKVSFIFGVNCIYRHLLFSQKNYLNDFISGMSAVGPYVGMVGGGEQYKWQHVNQTMVCAVFE